MPIGPYKIPTAKKPRISVNKLAEYLESTSSRRKKIVTDAKYPQEYVTTRYKDAREHIKRYVCKGVDEDAILLVIDAFNSTVPETDFQKQDNDLSAEVLALMLDMDLGSLSNFDLKPFEGNNDLLEIAGVDVSVNPDLLITKDNGAETYVGAGKLHLSKSNQLSDESQKIVGVLLYRFTEDFIIPTIENSLALPKLCFSIDLFAQTIECCPSSTKMRLRKIEDACEEIALWWNKL
ncbi:MAG TPA: hypothetical protein VGM30_04665 [Puia sp.]|jgi:hypothetical protein